MTPGHWPARGEAAVGRSPKATAGYALMNSGGTVSASQIFSSA